MDSTALVTAGRALVQELDARGFRPRFAMWVHNVEMQTWKLWLVPPRGQSDKANFYRRVAEAIAANRAELSGIDAGDTELVSDTHPAVLGVSRFIGAPGLVAIHFAGNMFDGYYLPDGIVLRSEI